MPKKNHKKTSKDLHFFAKSNPNYELAAKKDLLAADRFQKSSKLKKKTNRKK